jgi:hypothetical protein
MDGGTTFHFVTGGIHEALERAREAAGGKDVRVGGGERLFDGVDLRTLGYQCVKFAASEKATHVVLRHQGRAAPN